MTHIQFNKKTRQRWAFEYQRLRKMSFWEIFDFRCIYLTKLEYRPSLKFLRIFIMIRDDMTLVGVPVPAYQIYTDLCYCPGLSLFQILLS